MEQLSLWNEPGKRIAAPAESHCLQSSQENLDRSDIEAMRAWLLDWGKRHGYPGIGFPIVRGSEVDRRRSGLSYGVDGWAKDVYLPYKFSPMENYPGEVLAAAVEQCERYDAGEKIPWFEFDLGKTNVQTHTSWEDEE